MTAVIFELLSIINLSAQVGAFVRKTTNNNVIRFIN